MTGEGGWRARRRRRRQKRSLLWRLRRPLYLIGLVMLAGAAGVGVLFVQTELPEVEALTQSSYFCASDVEAGRCRAQNAMARIQAEGDGERVNVSLEDMPQVLIDAVIAVEDRDFFEHRGVDPIGIARALYQDVRGSEVTQGGSTITQQYVKTAFDLTREKSVTRKINEAVLSVKLEQEMSKEEILEGYLNTIYFGRGAYGVGAAAEAYFGKDVRNIGLPAASFLAGLIRAPNLAEPTKHPEEAARRRSTTLGAMEDEGYITAEQVARVEDIPLAKPHIKPFNGVKLVDTRRGGRSGAQYVTNYVSEELLRLGFSEQEITSGGLRVYTSLHYEMQQAAWDAVTSTLTEPNDPDAALVAVDDQGLIRAMVGNRKPYKPGKEGSENNLAVRGLGSQGRQTGSAAKPLALADAVRRNYSLESRYDAPAEVEIPFEKCPNYNEDTKEPEPWTPENYSDASEGVMDLVDATRLSSNTAYAQLIADLGPEGMAQLANELGVGGEKGVGDPGCAMVLGTALATPVEMAGVYSTFANRGVYRQPEIITRVEQVDEEGEPTVLYERQVTEKRVLTQAQADLVNHTLQTVIQSGTGTAADIGKPAAGKTGTGQEYKDAWFAGYVPRLTAVVWMGDAKDNTPMEGVHGLTGVTGGSLPAEIWRRFMEVATVGMDDGFVEPSAEALEAGTVINEGVLLTPDETTTTRPEITLPDRPGPTVPLPGRGGGGGGPPTPTTTQPPETTTTSETTTTNGPPTSEPPDDTLVPPTTLGN